MCRIDSIISNSVLAFVALCGFVVAYPKIRVTRQAPGPEEALGLPSNATSIRSEIADSFSCDSRIYGYYADVDNECQLFHVCLPVQFADGKEQTFKWSFICPEETVFNQESFTCTRPEDAVACEEAPQYYSLNEGFGQTDRPAEPSPAPASAITAEQRLSSDPTDSE